MNAARLIPRALTLALAGLVIGGLPATAHGQTLVDDGLEHEVAYTSAHVPQDFTIPDTNYLEVKVRGARGGTAIAGSCSSTGGRPAFIKGLFEVHPSKTGALRPGGILRFVIGQRGRDDGDSSELAGAASGGGGSAVLYKKNPSLPDDDFELLMVAGSGGGAYQGVFLVCVDTSPGGDARLGTSGGDGGGNAGSDLGGDGGENGKPGYGIWDTSSGGGGHYDGQGSVSSGDPGFPAGGDGSLYLSGTRGGWGYGGGGGGRIGAGGGGGYSGGGGGDVARRGGGGGSYIHKHKPLTSSKSLSNSTGNGRGFYTCYDALGSNTCADANEIGDGQYSGKTNSASQIVATDCGGAFPTKAAYYKYTNDTLEPRLVTVDTELSPNGHYNTLAVFDSCGSTTPIVCGTLAGSPLDFNQTATWTIGPGETHVIRVTSDEEGPFGLPIPGGDYVLRVDSGLVPVTNDTCATATPLAFGSYEGGVFGATLSGDATTCGAQTFNDVWYSYTNSGSSEVCVELKVTPEFALSGFHLEAYDSCGGSVITCLAATVPGEATELTWTVPAGATHLIRLGDALTGSDHDFVLDLYESSLEGDVTDLGNGLGAPAPVLTVDGSFCPGTTTTLELDGALATTVAYLVIGVTALDVPFKGGTLVPSPDIVLPIPTSPSGEIDVAFPWPYGVPSSVDTFYQYWIVDGTGPVGFTASNGVRATTP